MANDLTSQNIQDTYQRLLQISESGQIMDGTGSLVMLDSNSVSTASFAISASYALSASHEITYELSSSYANSASNASNAEHANTANTANSATTADSAGCADKVKTILSTANQTYYIPFVDSNNATATCESLYTTNLFSIDPGAGLLQFSGKFKVKGSDVTIEGGHISMSGAVTASNVSMSGDLSAVSGAFNHIVTDGDTIEFRNAGTGAKEGTLKFDGTNGLQVGDASAGNANFKAKIITAGEKFISAGSAEFTSDVTMSGDFSASGKIDTSKVKTNGMSSISPDGGNLQFGEDASGTRIAGSYINLGWPSTDSTQHVTASGHISSSGTILGNIGTFNDLGHITASGHISSSGNLYANVGTFNDITIADKAIDYIAPNIRIKHTGLEVANGHITASGNISSSGDVYASRYDVDGKTGLFLGSQTQLNYGFDTSLTHFLYGKSATHSHQFYGSITGSISFAHNTTTHKNLSSYNVVPSEFHSLHSDWGSGGGSLTVPALKNTFATITLPYGAKIFKLPVTVLAASGSFVLRICQYDAGIAPATIASGVNNVATNMGGAAKIFDASKQFLSLEYIAPGVASALYSANISFGITPS